MGTQIPAHIGSPTARPLPLTAHFLPSQPSPPAGHVAADSDQALPNLIVTQSLKMYFIAQPLRLRKALEVLVNTGLPPQAGWMRGWQVAHPFVNLLGSDGQIITFTSNIKDGDSRLGTCSFHVQGLLLHDTPVLLSAALRQHVVDPPTSGSEMCHIVRLSIENPACQLLWGMILEKFSP